MTDTQKLRFLVTTDGSVPSLRAVEHLIATTNWYQRPIEVHLLNVQAPLSGNVKMFIAAEQIRQFHQEEGTKALTAAKAKLDSARLPYVAHVAVGDPPHVIADYAKEKGCDQILIGTRGLGAVAGTLLGSVTRKVIHLAEVPVLLIK